MGVQAEMAWIWCVLCWGGWAMDLLFWLRQRWGRRLIPWGVSIGLSPFLVPRCPRGRKTSTRIMHGFLHGWEHSICLYHLFGCAPVYFLFVLVEPFPVFIVRQYCCIHVYGCLCDYVEILCHELRLIWLLWWLLWSLWFSEFMIYYWD